jgi:hypothetical protein
VTWCNIYYGLGRGEKTPPDNRVRSAQGFAQAAVLHSRDFARDQRARTLQSCARVTGLALTLLLAVPTEPTPPPLVPLESGIDQAFEEPVPRPPREPPVQAKLTESYGNPAQRVFITALSGAGASAVTFGLVLLLNDQVSKCNNSLGGLLPVLAVPMTLMITGAITTGVHRKLDGQGSLWSHIGGTAIGAGLGLAIWAFSSNLSFSTGTTTTIGVGTATALLAGLGAALMGELSHYRWWNENHPEVALVPIKGGATASLGWSF